MTTGSILNEIETTLADAKQGDFVDSSRRLLETLGYRSERTLELSGKVDDFIKEFPANNEETRSKKSFRTSTESVRIVFQFTDSEVAETQRSLLERGDFDKGNSRSFMFIAVELIGKSYPRGAYVELTREINKRLIVPTVVLFRTADDRVSVSFVHRRPHKRDRTRDVLGNVSLIREIDTSKPHRAYLDILRKLALSDRLSWMDAHRKLHNFDGLLDAWLDALDTEELNRNFYGQLFTWFERVICEARFPDNQVKSLPPKVHVIRLITRLLFVWFVKEKGLIASDLFIEKRIGPLLRDYDSESGDSYYRAVLQNLFFATLNSEIGERSFSKGSNSTHRNFSRYRFSAEIADPNGLMDLFARTPFINGGLFDCLDSFESTRDGGYRIDCFTDNVIDPKSKEFGILSIPNRLFFDNEGLIAILARFQFTVEENTPTEQEVALDPELLGKVFENLLAANVVETEENARKQTGSYYTPRAVVDYMVDEAIVASLAQQCAPSEGNTDSWQNHLTDLLDYEVDFDGDTEERFTDIEKKHLVRAIAGIKVIDPAVGSGAFPMGVLHKLTLALRRLDPRNELWEELQKELAIRRAEKAFDKRGQVERDAELKEISATFGKYRGSDFGRKLYLIQNSIYGVDIQPIACQIARLRFFISLAIEQEPGGEIADNYGIKPLPNLETRFVAANTLMALNASGTQMSLIPPEVIRLQEEINTNRERHFHAATRQKKKACRDRDHELRNELAGALQLVVGLPAADATNISGWDPYDQNAHADWFDAEIMFGVADGFDIVIGNPPYVSYGLRGGQKMTKDEKSFFRRTFSNSAEYKISLYAIFMDKGLQIAKSDGGLATFIVPDSFLMGRYFSKIRKFILETTQIIHLTLMSFAVFEATVGYSVVYLFQKKKVAEDHLLTARLMKSNENVVAGKIESHSYPQVYFNVQKHNRFRLFFKKDLMELVTKIENGKSELGSLIKFRSGLISKTGQKNIVSDQKQGGRWLPAIVSGKEFSRYVVVPDGYYIDYDKPKIKSGYGNVNYFEDKVLMRQTGDSLICAIDDRGLLALNNVHVGNKTKEGVSLQYVVALLNSRLMDFYYRTVSLESGRVMAQIDIEMIESLPFNPTASPFQEEIESLVNRILSAKALDPYEDTSEIEVAIDQLIYNLYDLTNVEVSVVEDTLITV